MNDLPFHSSSSGGGSGGAAVEIIKSGKANTLNKLTIHELTTEEYNNTANFAPDEMYLVPEPEYALKEDLDSYQQKITWGTDEPSGGKDGDIYIQIIE